MNKLWLGLIIAGAVFVAGIAICRGGRPGSGAGVDTAGSGIKGIVLMGPTCPTVRDPQDD